MSDFEDKWMRVLIGMSKQEVYSIIGSPDTESPPSRSFSEQYEFWNRDGKAYQCTFSNPESPMAIMNNPMLAMGAGPGLVRKKINGVEDLREPPSLPAKKLRVLWLADRPSAAWFNVFLVVFVVALVVFILLFMRTALSVGDQHQRDQIYRQIGSGR